MYTFDYRFYVLLLLQLVREYDGVGIQVLLASPSTPLCESLKRHGFFKRYSSDHLFPTVGSAVRYAKDGNRVVSIWYESLVSQVRTTLAKLKGCK